MPRTVDELIELHKRHRGWIESGMPADEMGAVLSHEEFGLLVSEIERLRADKDYLQRGVRRLRKMTAMSNKDVSDEADWILMRPYRKAQEEDGE